MAELRHPFFGGSGAQREGPDLIISARAGRHSEPRQTLQVKAGCHEQALVDDGAHRLRVTARPESLAQLSDFPDLHFVPVPFRAL